MGKMVVTGIVTTLVVLAVLAVALVVLTGSSLFDSFYNEQSFRIESMVREAVILYREDGQNAFSVINGMHLDDSVYPFVVSADTLEFVAHGANPDLIGLVPQFIVGSDRPVEQILDDLHGGSGTWIESDLANPQTGIEESRIIFLYLHDQYIFGAESVLP